MLWKSVSIPSSHCCRCRLLASWIWTSASPVENNTAKLACLQFSLTHMKEIIYFSPEEKKSKNNMVIADWRPACVCLHRSYLLSLWLSVCSDHRKLLKALPSSVICKPKGPRSDSRRPYVSSEEWTHLSHGLRLRGFGWTASQECGSIMLERHRITHEV